MCLYLLINEFCSDCRIFHLRQGSKRKSFASFEQIFFYDRIAKIAAKSVVGNRMNLPLSNEVEAP